MLRMCLLAALLVGVIFVLVGDAGAQTGATPAAGAAAAGAGTTPPKVNIFSIIPLDWVTVLIGVLSFVAVTLIVQGFIKTRESVFIPAAAINAIQEMIQNRQFRELIDYTERDPSFVAKVLNPALKRAPSFNAMKEALETAAGEQTANSFRKIEYLNILGNLGPLLGLLGTVLGMMEAFAGVQAAGGQADVAVLSGGISKALAHTFLGLALAIPCLSAFGILRTLTDRLTVEGSLKAEELLLLTKPPEGKPVDAKPTVAAAAIPSRPAPSPVLPPKP
jgi:biopolymer transport protein ExbB